MRSHFRDHGRVLLAASCLTIIACGPDATRDVAASSSTSDSAGVEIVTHQLDFYRAVQRLEQPVLEIGEADADDPNYELFRVTDVALTRDGIVVGQSDGEIRLFSSEGEFVRRIGGRGGGPGEFESVDWMGAFGDTLVISDWGQARVSLVNTAGDFLESWMLNAVPVPEGYYGRPWIVGAVDVGHLVLKTQRLGGGGGERTVRRDTKVITWSLSSDSTIEIGPFPGEEAFARGMSVPPFRRSLLLDVLPSGQAVVVDTEHPEIKLFVGDRLERLFRLEGNLERQVTDDVVDRMIADQALVIPDRETRDRVAANTRALITHNTTPALEGLVVGSDSTIWVARYTVSFTGPLFWIVLGSDGGLRTTVELPAYHFLFAVSEEQVVTVWRSPETDVETIRVFRRNP